MAKLALNNGVAGALVGPSSYLMKSPPKQIVDDEAYELTEEFIREIRRARGEAQAPAEVEHRVSAEFRSARSLARRVPTALFNAAYEGYLIPFHLDEHTSQR